MNIRQATPVDCAAIQQVMKNAFGPFQHLYSVDAYANTVVEQDEILRRMIDGITWIAEIEGKILGTVSIAFEDDWLYVTGMAVDPEAQGKKMGYELLITLEKYAVQNAYKQLYLGTLPFLTRAIALYAGIGYRPHTQHEREWYGMSTVWFEKRL